MPEQAASLGDAARGAAANAPAVERRRAGRVEYTNPELIALLRGQPPAAAPAVDAAGDDLAPAKALMLGLPLGIVLWAGIAAVAWLVIG